MAPVGFMSSTLYLGWSNGVHGCLLSTGSGGLSSRPWSVMGPVRLFGGLRVCRREGRRCSGEPDEHRETAELRFHRPVLLLVFAAASVFARPVPLDVARRTTTSLGETQGLLGEYSGDQRTAAGQVEPARRACVSGLTAIAGAGRAAVVCSCCPRRPPSCRRRTPAGHTCPGGWLPGWRRRRTRTSPPSGPGPVSCARP